MDDHPPPPPPPHGERPKTTKSGLPDGNYDIFIIPPHSAGSGFLYLPSLQPQRNSFLAGVACTLLAYGLWLTVVPALRQWMMMIAASGGAGVALLVVGVGVVAWAFGKTQGENAHTGGGTPPPGGAGGGTSGQRSQNYGSYTSGAYGGSPPDPQSQWAPPGHDTPPPPPRDTDPPPRPQPQPQARPQPPPPQDAPPQSPKPEAKGNSAAWEKAKEETRKREEARKRAEDLRKMREEAAKRKEEADRQERAAAEKLRWETNRQREKEQRERDAREKLAKEKAEQDKAQREKDKREQEVRERIQKQKLELEKAAKEKAAAEAAAKAHASPEKTYERPTARSYASTETATSYHRARNAAASSASSYTASSYAPSVSTARTSPPPEYRGPYKTSDPDKVVIKGVYMYNNLFPKPVSQLVSGEGSVTDGLVLRLTTEGLFIDDDVRDVPQREWDVKAWGIKSVETGEMKPFQIVRASVRDVEGKKYVFVVPSSEGWKVDAGVLRLKKGPLVRSMSTSAMKLPEMKKVLAELGFI